jgi:di/tricarboxylate transporter
MLEVSAVLAFAVVAAAMFLFISGKLEVDVIALCVLLAVIVGGLIRPDQALYGFASPATATVAIFIPVATVLAMTRRVSSSKVLMPLSFASQFGGVCTLIGTSTNILVNSIAVSRGMKAFGLFEFAPLGMVMSAAGILYLMLIGRWLLPKRNVAAEEVDKYRLADYLAELRVAEQSPLVGQKWDKRKASKGANIDLIKIIRGDKPVSRPSKTIIREGDILLIHGDVDKLISMKERLGLGIQANVTMDDRELSSDEVRLVEVLIPPRSTLVGRTLRSSAFLRRY